jgi:hypothetical protein
LTAFEQNGYDRVQQALDLGTPTSFRRSLASQLASIVWAPGFTWMIWKGSGLQQPFFWLALAVVWISWGVYLLSPHKVTIEGSTVRVHWWYRRVRIARSSMSLEKGRSTMSRLFGYDLLVIGELGRFPVWPAYFLVTKPPEPPIS